MTGQNWCAFVDPICIMFVHVSAALPQSRERSVPSVTCGNGQSPGVYLFKLHHVNCLCSPSPSVRTPAANGARIADGRTTSTVARLLGKPAQTEVSSSMGCRRPFLKRVLLTMLTAALVGGLAATGWADEQATTQAGPDVQLMVDTVWVLVAAFLVFWMNAGFGCVEAGFCRAKNAVNILGKNFVVFGISSLGSGPSGSESCLVTATRCWACPGGLSQPTGVQRPAR